MTYSIDFVDTYLTGELVTNSSVVLPTNKQTPIHKAWLSQLIAPVQRLNDLSFNYYVNGSTYSSYSASVVYSLGDRINAGLLYQNAIYECTTATTSGTFSITNWSKILPSFIGYNERAMYTDNRIVYEWALNKYFGTTFRQPNYHDTSKSDIYIGDNSKAATEFWIGLSGVIGATGPLVADSGLIAPTYSTADGDTSYVWIGYDPSLIPAPGSNYTIYISATLSAILPGPSYSTVKSFADKINYSGVLYNIATY